MLVPRAQPHFMIFLLFCLRSLSLFPTLTPHLLPPLFIEERSGRNEGRHRKHTDQGGTSDVGSEVVEPLFSQVGASGTWGQCWLTPIPEGRHSSPQGDSPPKNLRPFQMALVLTESSCLSPLPTFLSFLPVGLNSLKISIISFVTQHP